MPCPRLFALLLAALATTATSAQAWTRPGHMVTAAVAFDILAARDPAILRDILSLLEAHPDKGPFEVAAGRATGEARDRRLFLEMARWPDDVRGGAFDHPTWHYAQSPLADPADPPPGALPAGLDGDALEAFALNARVAANPRASPPERAVALCWVIHLVGDIHQPLHAARELSARLPDGDRGGGLQYVLDPDTGTPISLHWLWDDSVNRQGDPEAASARARVLEAQIPRASLFELAAAARPEDFPIWRAQAAALAAPLVYAKANTALTAAAPPAQAAAYLAAMRGSAERQAMLASYRLSDVLEAIMRPAP